MTRAIMTGSSALLTVLGLGWLFLSEALAAALGHDTGSGELLQLLAADATPLAWAGSAGAVVYLGAFTRLMFWPPWGVRRDASADAGA